MNAVLDLEANDLEAHEYVCAMGFVIYCIFSLSDKESEDCIYLLSALLDRLFHLGLLERL